MSTALDLDRAIKAKALLEDQAFSEAYNNVRLAIIARIEGCPMADTAVAEDLRRCLRLLRDVKINLEAAIQSGKVSEFRLAQEEARKKNPLRGLFR